MKTLRDAAIAAGYTRLDMAKLLADLRTQPGCEKVSERMLYNYLAGVTAPRRAFAIGLSKVLRVPLEVVLLGGFELETIPESCR